MPVSPSQPGTPALLPDVASVDSTVAASSSASLTRPTEFLHEVALGRRTGATLWNKFGYNEDVGTTAEVVASWGGAFNPLLSASTLSVVSTDANDADGGTGAHGVVLYGVDADRNEQVEVVLLTGTTPVVTTTTWLGINRIALFRAGTGLSNAGTITATATSDASIQGQVPTGEGTSQQCIFHTQAGHQALAVWLTVSGIRFGSGTEPVFTVKGWVQSSVANARYEVLRLTLDCSIEDSFQLTPPVPFPIGAASTFWLEVESSRAASSMKARFSLVEYEDAT